MFLITRLLRFSVRHPRVVVSVAGALTLCALVFIPRIQLRLDGRSLIPSNLPQFAEGDEAASRFELRDLVLIGVGNEESGIYTPETLQRIARLSAELSRVNGVVPGSVVSLSTVPRVALVDGKVDTDPLLRPADQLNAETIQQLRREVVKRGYNTGTLVSADGKGTAIIAKVEPGADRYRLLQDTRSLIAGESSGKDSVYLSGSVILIAVGVSDDVYALGHYFREAEHAKNSSAEETIVAAFSSAARPVGMTAISTVVGLLSMAAVSLNPLRVFGVFGSVAIVFSTLFTFSLLPAMLALLKPNIRWKGETKVAVGGRPAASALRMLTAHVSPRRVAVCALLVAVCAIVATTRLRVDDSWIRNLPTNSDIVRGDRFFNEKMAGTTAVETKIPQISLMIKRLDA